MTQEISDSAPGVAVTSGNSGSVPKNAARAKPATAQASATGRKPLFGTEGAATADYDSRRQRFEYRDLRRHTTFTKEDGFDRLRNAMAFDFFRAVAGHETHDETTDYRDENHPAAERVECRRTISERKSAEEKQIREQVNHAQQDEGGERTEHADPCGKRGNTWQPRIGRKITLVGVNAHGV